MKDSATSRQRITALHDSILQARVEAVAIESPLDHASRLSARTGNRVFFKREDLQSVFSFKLRGAYNKISQLADERLRRGVVASSAGNHAQGVALAARRRDATALIVMPTGTASIKVDAVRALGAQVVLHGETYDDANAHALELARERSMEFVHPFADPAVIAGQGTIGLELAKQWQEPPAAIFVPIGGGGLVSGIGAFIKCVHPEVSVIGVEPADAPSMHEALGRGAPVTLDSVGIFADAVAVRRVSDLTYSIAREVVDEILLVDTDAICAAIKDIFEDTRAIVEPAGALAVAGYKAYVEREGTTEKTFIAINSGANINFDRLRHVSERAEIGEHREAIFAVEIPEEPGAFLQFSEIIGDRSVTEFNYRYAPTERAQIFVGVSLGGSLKEADDLASLMRHHGYKTLNLSDNELAKLHIRHLVGGHGPGLEDERIFRFEFPERPGALRAFLREIGSRWNISLFHYRNHGSDYGRVLAGVQIPPRESDTFRRHLETLAYSYREETDNPAYRLFLR